MQSKLNIFSQDLSCICQDLYDDLWDQMVEAYVRKLSLQSRVSSVTGFLEPTYSRQLIYASSQG